MQLGTTVSRRKAVTLVASTLAASAGAAGAVGATAAVAHRADQSVRVTAAGDTALGTPLAATLLADSRRRMFELLHAVRRAPGTPARSAAFRRFADALRLHEHAELSFGHADAAGGGRVSGSRIGALYRQDEADALLARVIVRELEARPAGDAAWFARFADLEAVLDARARKRARTARGHEPVRLA